MNHPIATAGHGRLLQRKWSKRIGAAMAASCCAMLGLALVARADVSYQDPAKAMVVTLVAQPDGSNTLTISGDWLWPSHQTGDCNEDRYAIGWAADWNDPDPVSGAGAEPLGVTSGPDPKMGDSTSRYGTDPSVPLLFRGKQRVFYNEGPTPPRCGVFGNHANPAGDYSTGSWGPISHTYAKSVTTFSACVLLYDLKGPGDGALGKVLGPHALEPYASGGGIYGGFKYDRMPIAAGQFHNTDNSREDSAASPFPNKCINYKFVKSNLSTQASLPAVGISDTAILSNVPVTAGGTVTFKLYGPSETAICTGTPRFTSVVSIAQDPANPASSIAKSGAPSGTYPTGNYWWVAAYSGGSTGPSLEGFTSYLPSVGACGDPNEGFTVLPPNGALILRKEVDKAPATNATFSFDVPCLGPLSPVTLIVPAGQTSFETAPFSLASGTKCIVKEQSDGDPRFTLNLLPQPEVVISSGSSTTVTIINTEKRGSVTVTKNVVGWLQGDPTDFTYVLSCDGVKVPFGATGNNGVLKASESETYEDLAMGAQCSVTESPSVPDVFISTISPVVTISADQKNITITNSRRNVPIGKLRVQKVVTAVPATDANFTFSVNCTNPVATYTVNSQVLAGQLSAESPDLVNIPAGSSCEVQETIADPQYYLNGIPNTVTIEANKTSVVKIVNIRDTSGVVWVKKIKAYPGGVRPDGDPADPAGGFTFDLTCGGVLLKPNGPTQPSGQAQTSQSIRFFDLPIGIECSASETNVPSMFTSTVSAPIIVRSGALQREQTITITNTRRYVSIPVKKTLSGGVGPAEFGFTLKCVTPTFEPGQLLVTVLAGQTVGVAEFTNVPAGASCTISETKIADGYSGASDIKFTAGTGDAPSFTNTRIIKPGTLLVEKNVNVAPSSIPATFTFSVDCPPAAKKQILVTVGIGELTGSTLEGSALPVGTNCTVTETLPDDRYSPPAPLSQKATIVENQQSIVSFFNSRLTGTVKVKKDLQGPSVGGDPTSFPYTLTCNGLLVPSAKSDGNGELTSSETESYVGIETGAVCVAAEPGVPSIFSASIDPSAGVKVVVGDTLITITNTRKTGKLIVEKTVTSPPKGKSASFTFGVDCPGMTSQTISVTVDPDKSKGSSVELLGIPIGVICKVTEQAADGRYSRNSLPVDSGKVQELTTAFARFTNTRLTGKVIVEKVVVGGFSSDPDTFKYTLSCDGVPIVVDGIVKVGAPQTTSGIDTGKFCAAIETNPPDPVFTAGVSSGVTVGTEDATITITNTRKVVSISVSKTLQGGVGPATFGFTLNCTNPTFGPITKAIAIGKGAASAQETITGVPLSASCTVTESSPDNSYLPASGAKTFVAGLENPTVVFTNTKKLAIVDLVKSADRSTVRPGEEVNYKVEITNRGNYDLKAEEVTVKDDHCTLSSPTEGVGTDKILSIGETWTYTCAVKLAVDTTNKATVDYPGGSKEGTKFVDVINPGIHVTKKADKAVIVSGTSVTYTYKVTNTGDDPLSKISLQDDICGPAVYLSGDANSNSKLEKTEEWEYTCKQLLTDAKVNVQPNMVLNSVTATGLDSLAGTVSSDKKTASVVIIHPSIALRKSASAATVHASDEPVEYTFVVSNTGDSPVSSVSVVDDKCKPLSAPTGDTNNNAKLDVGEFWTYTCTQSLSITTTNVAKANGKDELGNTVAEKTATATVMVIKPAIAIAKSASATSIIQGASVTYTYKVTNPGDVALGAVVVSDDKCTPLSAPAGDTNNNAKLETTETWTFTCTQAIAATTTNTAIVTGIDPLERSVSAQAKATVTATPTTTTTTTTTTTVVPIPVLIPAPPVTTTPTTTAAPAVAALVFQPVAQPVPVTTTQVPVSTTPVLAAPAVVVPASVLAASLPQAPPPNVLGVQVSKTEPAFTGSGSTTQLLGFLGLIALALGALLLLSPRRQAHTEDQ